MATTFPLFNLSPEMQELVLSNVVDLPTVRLVSREVEAVAFKFWAEEYLSKQRCFCLDPARLQRLKNLTSTPCLACKIKEVTFCLDPLEGADQGSLCTVLEKYWAQCGARGLCHDMKYAQWTTSRDRIREEQQDMHRNDLDQTLLSSIFHDLQSKKDCKVHLELTDVSLHSELFNEADGLIYGFCNNPSLPQLTSINVDIEGTRAEEITLLVEHSKKALKSVVLVGAETMKSKHWLEVLEGLKSCDDLELLTLWNLQVGEHGQCIQLLDETGSPEQMLSVKGRENVQEMLRRNIEHGVHGENADPFE